MELVSAIAARGGHFLALCWARLLDNLLSPSAQLSIYSLGVALIIGAVWMTHGRRRKVRLRALVKVMFPRRWLVGPSARADWGFAVLNIFITGSLLGWAIVSSGTVATVVEGWLIHAFGPAGAVVFPGWLAVTLVTLGVYLAYETAYWVDHYLSHHVPLLWHFHRVHHTAETLSPLTNFRVHPVDSLVFYNFIGLFTGIVGGATSYWLKGTDQFTLAGGNALIVVALYLLTHLQHSHIWIALPGRLGRLVMSPAHHQLHHSDDPRHFNRNFGNTLALFDWIAGTLHVPTRARQRLSFGSGPYRADPHGVTGGLIQPFVEAAEALRPPTTVAGITVPGR